MISQIITFLGRWSLVILSKCKENGGKQLMIKYFSTEEMHLTNTQVSQAIYIYNKKHAKEVEVL